MQPSPGQVLRGHHGRLSHGLTNKFTLILMKAGQRGRVSGGELLRGGRCELAEQVRVVSRGVDPHGGG